MWLCIKVGKDSVVVGFVCGEVRLVGGGAVVVVD